MIKIVGHPIRHKKRIKEIQATFLDSGAEVDVCYENTNHITITNENRESKDREDKNES